MIKLAWVLVVMRLEAGNLASAMRDKELQYCSCFMKAVIIVCVASSALWRRC